MVIEDGVSLYGQLWFIRQKLVAVKKDRELYVGSFSKIDYRYRTMSHIRRTAGTVELRVVEPSQLQEMAEAVLVIAASRLIDKRITGKEN